MNLNSRTELEEERRLFYVALTRAEKKIYLSYVLSRYRWGKPVDSEKSRFIDEIKEEYLQNNVIQRSISKDFSQKSQFNKVGIRYKKPETRPAKNFVKLKSSSSKSNLFDNKLIVGNIVIHERFGKGEVISIEGRGGDRKAEIKMTLTTPNCPVAESLPKEVKEGAMQVEEIDDVDLQLVWDPPWTKDMMSDAAKLELNL